LRIPDAPPPGASPHVQPVATPAGGAEQAGLAGSEHDKVSIGPIAAAASNTLNAPAEKIAELREQYLSGTYSVDADKLSSKIIDEHLQPQQPE
jgi:anti-sigma28 factor (negative regulator of flagellin synthesis)